MKFHLFVLFLSLQSDTKVINAALTKVFTKFGPIQRVERITSSAANLKPDVYEAYILFKHSEDAYKAFMANRDDSKSSEEVIAVLPVNTWKLERSISQKAELAELSRRIVEIDNEDDDTQFIYKMYITPGMLLRVFRLFILKSKDFLTGLYLHYGLEPLNDSEDSDNDDDDDKEWTDNEKPTQKIDPTVETNCITAHEFEKRIAEVVAKNVGKTFTTLTLQKSAITVEMLQWFAPVLKQLTDLRIHTEYDCSLLFALHGYCPNVRSFHLDGVGWEGEFDHVAIEKWPSLRDLYLNITDMDEDVQCTADNRKLQKFIEANPQIYTLQIDSIIDLEIVTAIGKTLKDLNALAFVRPSFEGLNLVLDNLTGLTKLNGLKFSALEVRKSDLNALAKCAKRLSRLPELQLITIFMNCEPDTGVRGSGDADDDGDGYNEEEDFEHLKEFNITHHHNCKCHGPDRILSFDKKKIVVPEQSAVLVLIVNTKPPCTSKDKTLKASILKAFKKTTKYFPNIIEEIEQAEEESYLYIQISSNSF